MFVAKTIKRRCKIDLCHDAFKFLPDNVVVNDPKEQHVVAAPPFRSEDRLSIRDKPDSLLYEVTEHTFCEHLIGVVQ